MQKESLQTTSTQALRIQARSKRRSLSNLQQQLASKRCFEKLKRNSDFLSAKHIAFYSAMDSEINIDLLINFAQSQKKQCYLPSIKQHSQDLIFYKIGKNEILTKRHFDIPEPKKRKSIHVKNIDLVLMPLLAFDSRGNRLGMGGGYYDYSFRHLSGKNNSRKVKLVGVAHQCQQVNAIDAQEWDIKPDKIYTF